MGCNSSASNRVIEYKVDPTTMLRIEGKYLQGNIRTIEVLSMNKPKGFLIQIQKVHEDGQPATDKEVGELNQLSGATVPHSDRPSETPK